MTDTKPECTLCKYAHTLRHAFLSSAAPTVLVCRHASALRLNGGPWACSIARDVCRGRRYDKR